MARQTLPRLLVASLFLVASGCSASGEEDGLDITGAPAPETEPTYDFGEPGTGLLRYSTELTALSDSGVKGRAVVDADEDGVTVTIEATGFSDGLAHAQHLHLGGDRACPDPAAAGGDELLETVESEDYFSAVAVSLTTTGDVGPESALALDRFPTAIDGAIGYARTFELPTQIIAEDLNGMVIVQHGSATLGGDPNVYDGDQASPLDPELPLEATLPVSCGVLQISETPES